MLAFESREDHSLNFDKNVRCDTSKCRDVDE